MTEFLKETKKWKKFELLIDYKIYSKEIILRTAYLFLDKWYFFFKEDEDKNLVLQFTLKPWVKDKLENIISDFSDELLNTQLRATIAQENKEIRNEVIKSAIQNSLREAELPNDWKWYDQAEDNYFDWPWWDSGQIDFDKDIDEILKEIENDPELKIDEEEIEKILKEIEEESKQEEEQKPEVKLNIDAAKKAKENFKKKTEK